MKYNLRGNRQANWPCMALLSWLATLTPLSNANAVSSEQIVSELNTKNLITDAYDNMLENFFERANENRDIEEQVLVVNEYTEESINVVVVEARFSSTNSDFLHSLGVHAEIVSRNAFAVNNDLIIVGERLLADILLSSYNAVFGFVQTDRLIADGFIQGDPFRYFEAMHTNLSLANIWASELEIDDEIFSHPLSRGTQGHPVTLGREIASQDELVHDFYYFSLLFLFQHEIAHLNEAGANSFTTLQDLVFNDYNVDRIEEDRADQVARQQIQIATNRIEDERPFFAIMAIAGYFRDTLLSRYFNDLDRYPARQRFVSFVHETCDPGRARFRGYRRDSSELVISGFLSPLPILSNEEAGLVRARIRADRAMSTHPHNFVRAARLLDVIEFEVLFRGGPPFNSFTTISPYRRMVDSLHEGLPYIRPNDIPGVTDFESESTIQDLRRLLPLESSPVCHLPLRCMVGSTEDGIRVELSSLNDRLKYLNIMLPLADAYSSNSDDALRYHVEGFLVVYAHFLSELTNPTTPLETLEYVVRHRNELLSCGFAHSYEEHGNTSFEISTLDGRRTVQLRIWPSEYNYFSLQ